MEQPEVLFSLGIMAPDGPIFSNTDSPGGESSLTNEDLMWFINFFKRHKESARSGKLLQAAVNGQTGQTIKSLLKKGALDSFGDDCTGRKIRSATLLELQVEPSGEIEVDLPWELEGIEPTKKDIEWFIALLRRNKESSLDAERLQDAFEYTDQWD